MNVEVIENNSSFEVRVEGEYTGLVMPPSKYTRWPDSWSFSAHTKDGGLRCGPAYSRGDGVAAVLSWRDKPFEITEATDRNGDRLMVKDAVKICTGAGISLGNSYVIGFEPVPAYDRYCIGIIVPAWGSLHPALVEKVLDNST